jgi:DNA (cytosine-5)-methyltransferase 1
MNGAPGSIRRKPYVVVDLFAGGGGASEGIRRALGTSPAVAIDHDEAAIRMHEANHPETHHLREDLLKIKPFRPGGKPIDLLWASPNCTDFSRAKGGKPKDHKLRILPWVIVEWARAVTPRVILAENVVEWLGWSPLDENDLPIKEKKGETFREFIAALQLAGYRVEHRVLNAADFGAPTARHRLFLVARNDGQAIRWPEPTHGPGRPQPWRTAAECIDWSIPMLSIFASKGEARAWKKQTGLGLPKRPLAEATLRRIAEGVRRYVLTAAKPFLVRYQGERRPGETGRVHDLEDPLPTQTTENRFGLVAPSLTKFYGSAAAGQRLDEPMPTITTGGERGGGHAGLVAAYLAKHNGSGENWADAIGQDLREPCHTITVTDTKALVTASLGDPGDRADQVAAFLIKYYGQGVGQRLSAPLDTITCVDRFGLVTVDIQGESWVLTDISMRMLVPRELATATGFEPSYVMVGNKKEQTGRIGNAVSPHPACALVASQFGVASPPASI